jgi:RimJ/RimL family protein N-acetyltransferase
MPQYWGKGYATEIAIAAIQYGFNEMNVNTIYGTAHVDNIGSSKALLKAGLIFIEYFEHDDAPMGWYRIDRKS